MNIIMQYIKVQDQDGQNNNSNFTLYKFFNHLKAKLRFYTLQQMVPSLLSVHIHLFPSD